MFNKADKIIPENFVLLYKYLSFVLYAYFHKSRTQHKRLKINKCMCLFFYESLIEQE